MWVLSFTSMFNTGPALQSYCKDPALPFTDDALAIWAPILAEPDSLAVTMYLRLPP